MPKLFHPVIKEYSFIISAPRQKHKIVLTELISLIKAAGTTPTNLRMQNKKTV